MSATDTTPTVIFFGHGTVADQVRRNLTDLSSLGMVKPFYWVDPRLPDSAAATPSVRVVSGSGQRILPLDQALRTISGTILFLALDVESATDTTTTSAGLDMGAVDRWTNAVESRLSTAPGRVRVLLPRVPRGNWSPTSHQSWPTTVAIAPEDSEAPHTPLEPVLRAGDPTDIARVAAPTLCGLTGLWSSATGCALTEDNGAPISTGGEYRVRLARSYHRTIDASTVEDQLRRQASDVRDRLPQPVTPDGRQASYLGQDEGVPEAMAQRLLAEHGPSLTTPMQPEDSGQVVRKKWWKALFSFLGDYFRMGLGSPKSWAQKAGQATLRAAENRTQTFLYGEDSPVRVVSNSASSPAQSMSLDDMSATAAWYRRQALQSGVRVGEVPQLSEMWDSYKDISLTLVDGTERQQGNLQSPKDAWGNRAIVRQGWQAVPDVDDSFHGFHPLLGQRLGISEEDATIRPFDARKAAAYEEGIAFVAGQTREPEIRQLQADFAAWKQTASRSFAWQTGEGLTGLIDQSRHNVHDQLERYDRHKQNLDDLDHRDTAGRNSAYTRTTFSLLGLEFLLILFLAYSTTIHYKSEWQLSFFSGFDWRWALGWFLLGSFVLMVIHMVAYARARRGVERYLENLRLFRANVQITGTNVNAAMENYNRQIAAYRQLLSWSTVLGRAISRPLGRDLSTGEGLASPSAGLPLSTRIGQAAVPDEKLVPLVNSIREKLFPSQWASNALDSLMEDAAASLSHHTGEHTPPEGQLRGQSGAGTGSPLDRLTAWSVAPQLEDRDHTRQHWARIIGSPEASKNFGRELAETIDTVLYFENGAPMSTTKEQFLSTLHTDNRVAGNFLQDVVSTVALNDGATSMDPNVCRLDRTRSDASHTLTRSATLVQFGRTTALSNLGGETEAAADVPVTSTEMPVFEAAPFETPTFDAPSFEAPSFEAPTFDGPRFGE